MSHKGVTADRRQSKEPRFHGVLFDNVSIDKAAYFAARAAACWGELVTLAIHDDNRVVCYCPGTREEVALWKDDPGSVVGVFRCGWTARVTHRKNVETMIGDAILAHLEERLREAA